MPPIPDKGVPKSKKTIDQDRVDPKLDWEWRVGPDPRDPLCDSCQHEAMDRKANQHAAWWKCKECDLRIFYIPRKGKTGRHRAAGPLPADVKWPESKPPAQTRTTATPEAAAAAAGPTWEAYLPTPPPAEGTARETSPTPSFGRRGRAEKGSAARNVSPKSMRNATPRTEMTPPAPTGQSASPAPPTSPQGSEASFQILHSEEEQEVRHP